MFHFQCCRLVKSLPSPYCRQHGTSILNIILAKQCECDMGSALPQIMNFFVCKNFRLLNFCFQLLLSHVLIVHIS